MWKIIIIIIFFLQCKDTIFSVFSPETVNIKKLANLAVNAKNYRQITLNNKPYSGPPTTTKKLDRDFNAVGP